MTVRHILDHLSLHPVSSEREASALYSQFAELGTDLKAAMARIAAMSSYNEGSESYESNPILDKWARLLLSAFVDQRYCILSHSLLRASVATFWTNLYSE